MKFNLYRLVDQLLVGLGKILESSSCQVLQVFIDDGASSTVDHTWGFSPDTTCPSYPQDL